MDLGDSVYYPQDKLGRSFLKMVGVQRFASKKDADLWFNIKTYVADLSFETLKEEYDYFHNTLKKSKYVALKCVLRKLNKVADEAKAAGHEEEMSEKEQSRAVIDDMYKRMGFMPPNRAKEDW